MKYKHYVNNYEIAPTHPLSVNLIGCGGTGSQVLTSLGRMNYALLRLGHPGFYVCAYDADVVTDANCGRQLFSEQEVGMNKAVCLITKLNYFFGSAWEAIPEMYGENSEKANITISCVDTINARQTIAKALAQKADSYVHDMHRAHYWLDFGNMANTGQAVLGTAGNNFTQPKGKENVERLLDVTEMFDFKNLKDSDSGPSCSLAEALSRQDLFINSTLAHLGCAMLWKMFTKAVLDVQGVYLNLETMRVSPIPVKPYNKTDKKKPHKK